MYGVCASGISMDLVAEDKEMLGLWGAINHQLGGILRVTD